MKKYFLYAPYLAVYGILSIPSLAACFIGLCICAYMPYKVAGHRDGLFLIPILLILGAIAVIYGCKSINYRRYFLRCSFTEQGVQCSGWFWKPFLIKWSDIRAYGTYTNKFSYLTMDAVFFSANPEEYGAKNAKEALAVRKDRLVFELRPKLEPALFRHMPEDMKKKLQYVISRNENSFFRR